MKPEKVKTTIVCCTKCIYSCRLYAEVSIRFGEYRFTTVKDYCYCTYKQESKKVSSKCKFFLPAYNDLEYRKREEEIEEDNLPF